VVDRPTCETEIQPAHLILCILEMIHDNRSQTIKQLFFTVLFSYITKLQ